MRKIVRANDAVAIAIGAAMGSVENSSAHGSLDHIAEVDSNPLVATAANAEAQPGTLDANHFDIFDLHSADNAATVNDALTDGSPSQDEASSSLVPLLNGDANSHDGYSITSWGGSGSAHDDVFDTAEHDFGAHPFQGSDGRVFDVPSAESFGVNAKSDIAPAGGGPLGNAELGHINSINEAASSAAVVTGGSSSTGAPASTSMGPRDADVHGDGDGAILFTGDAGGTGGSGGTSTGGNSTVITGGAAGSGLVINVTYDASVANAPAAFKADVAAVVSYLESKISDSVTININVGYGEVDGLPMSGGAIGQSMYYVDPFSYSQVKNAMTADATSASDLSSIATLPSSDPTNGGTFYVTTANAKALGLISGSYTDGFVGFNSGMAFDYDNSDGVSAGTYDFQGVVLHEITEVLGRAMNGGQNATYYPLDLFHYSAPGVRTLSGTTPGYFSVDNGQTNLNTFNSNPGGDFGDWAGNTIDAANAFGSTGVVSPFSAADLAVMDVIGWNLATTGGAPVVTASLTTDTGISSTDKITSNATISGTGNPNAVVTITENGSVIGTVTANASGAWTFAPSGLASGTHTIVASETDSSGNTGTASLTFTLDTTAPVAPSIASFSTDSGTVGDGITNDNTLTLTGTAEANSTVKVFDGATLLGSVTADGTGAWTYTTAALANGAHSLTATATDAAGNTGTASAALNVTVDTTAPVAPSIASFSTDSGTVGDHITNDNTLTLTGTAEANSTVKVFDGATLLGSVTASGTGAWTYTTAALANGAHSLTATATDAAGNTGTASTALGVTSRYDGASRAEHCLVLHRQRYGWRSHHQ